VSQISPPIRVLLLCAVAFLAAWMLFLRPKEAAVEPPPAAPNVETGEPAVSQPGKVAEAAQEAVDAANSQLQAQESVDGVDAGESAAAGSAATRSASGGKGGGAAAIPADLKGVPKPVAKAIGKQQVLVLLFWNRESADDREVKRALAKVDRWDGRVYVHDAPIKSISKYGRITRGANVEQSPTVVVVDTELRADTVVGYVDAASIDQMVVDAFRNSGGLFEDKYLAKVNEACATYSNSIWTIPAADNGREYAGIFSSSSRKLARFERSFKAIKAPRKWTGFKRSSAQDFAAWGALLADWAAYLGPNPTLSRAVSGYGRFSGRARDLNRRINRRMDAEHLIACGSDA
jgi:hypothetical protein